MASRLEYRGYRLCFQVVLISGCDRIRRPDGSWRYSQPSMIGDTSAWVVLREQEPGLWQCVGIAATEAVARQLVDKVIQGERHG